MSNRDDAPLPTGDADGGYRVLARKYRPANFEDLIGQEALVRTLTNAIESGRLAHAFVLTGVRGVGKTTTARIIARALNCIGPDGDGGPTPKPCGVCEHCTAIAQDRHVDVIEMDAASRTGVADIRDLLDGVRYRPVQARRKIYIVDEVHMLSNQAFNALLKTLEEPPEHVIFIFATTEIRKVPVTVLSRCQRFDLRRVDQSLLAEHFGNLAGKESVEAEPEGLAMIARAADGSVRDGLSLMDQAIALGGGRIDAATVRDMLGLADRARLVDLFEAVVDGETAGALAILSDMYGAGANPAILVQDLLDFTHFLTRAKLVPETLSDPAVPETERKRGVALCEKLDMPALARTWQILLKGLGEVQQAPSPVQATEMLLIRLSFASTLPSPADLVRRLEEGGASSGTAPAGSSGGSGSGGKSAREQAQARSDDAVSSAPASGGSAGQGGEGRPRAALAARSEALPEPAQTPDVGTAEPENFEAVVKLCWANKEARLATDLANNVHLVRFEPGLLEINPGDRAAPNLVPRLKEALEKWTGRPWEVKATDAPGALPLREQERRAEAEAREQVLKDPLVQAVMKTFPDARLVDRRGAPAGDEALPPAGDGEVPVDPEDTAPDMNDENHGGEPPQDDQDGESLT